MSKYLSDQLENEKVLEALRNLAKQSAGAQFVAWNFFKANWESIYPK
jgi:hypothetical protein